MKKYILVTGGELFNKGAQAMTFITIDNLKKKYPNHEIIVFSQQDANRSPDEKANYNCTFLPFPGFGESIALITGLRKKHYSKKAFGFFDQYIDVFRNADMLLDISGYAIGSNWGIAPSRYYIRKIALAKHFKVPVILLPQSFGPFNYTGKYAWLIKAEIAHYFRYPKIIMARENDGLEAIKQICKRANVIKTCDMVLQTPSINTQNVYRSEVKMRTYKIKPNSVAVIPNSKNYRYGNAKEIEELYKLLIDRVLSNKKNVYLIYHAIEDKTICFTLKNTYYPNNENVIFIEDELNCIEFESTIQQFNFVVASRYHSIVHSYKEGVPAFIVGWAVKYQELAALFSQGQFCYGVDSINRSTKMLQQIDYLSSNYKKESEIILKRLQDIQKNNLFELIS